jgi:prepilin-type N-terminal cleavage/methylation domain-containing protein
MRATLPSPRSGFTLIELLVVIAIVAVLAVTVILTLNPAELLKQARDSNRLSDMDTINKAVALYQVDFSSGSLGITSKVYVSLPDTSSTCANLGLPTLPSGLTYNCAPTSTLKNIDGNGWLPINFASLSAGSPLPGLPLDPTNSASTGLYYTYVAGTSTYELASFFESSKYAINMLRDGGPDVALYEKGTGLSLAPFQRGLIGYWNFDEGSGTSVSDSSGNANTGTLINAPAWVTGKIGNALSFNGSNTYVSLGALSNPNAVTFFAWVNPTVGYSSSHNTIIAEIGTQYLSLNSNKGFLSGRIDTIQRSTGGNTLIAGGGWHLVVGTWSSATGAFNVYLDGNLDGSATFSGSALGTGVSTFIGQSTSGGLFFNGIIDDVRVYNRALSAAEIQAIYNATR